MTLQIKVSPSGGNLTKKYSKLIIWKLSPQTIQQVNIKWFLIYCPNLWFSQQLWYQKLWPNFNQIRISDKLYQDLCASHYLSSSTAKTHIKTRFYVVLVIRLKLIKLIFALVQICWSCSNLFQYFFYGKCFWKSWFSHTS